MAGPTGNSDGDSLFGKRDVFPGKGYGAPHNLFVRLLLSNKSIVDYLAPWRWPRREVNTDDDIGRLERGHHLSAHEAVWVSGSKFIRCNVQIVRKDNREGLIPSKFRRPPRWRSYHHAWIVVSARVASNYKVVFYSFYRAKSNSDLHVLERQKASIGNRERFRVCVCSIK